MSKSRRSLRAPQIMRDPSSGSLDGRRMLSRRIKTLMVRGSFGICVVVSPTEVKCAKSLNAMDPVLRNYSEFLEPGS